MTWIVCHRQRAAICGKYAVNRSRPERWGLRLGESESDKKISSFIDLVQIGKGKPTVEVGAANHLVGILEIIKKAVETGELDAQIESASGALRSGFKR